MRAYFLLLILLYPLSAALAQRIDISGEEKVTSSYYTFQVVGKNDLGILIYKHKRENEYLEIFDKNMALKRRKTLFSDIKNTETISVELTDNQIIQFFSYKSKKMDYLSVRRMNKGLEDIGDPILIDSVSRRVGEYESDFKIRRSKDSKTFLAYKSDLQNGEVKSISSLTLDSELRPKFRNTLQIASQDKDMIIESALINNAGTVYFVLRQDGDRLFSSGKSQKIVVYSCRGGGACKRFELISGEFSISQLVAQYDDLNEKLVITGFYSVNNETFISGYLYVTFDPDVEDFVVNSYTSFDADFVREVLGKINTKKSSIPVYEIGELILRSDGGVIIAAEYQNESQEAFEYSNYDPYYGYRTSTRYVNFYEYENIVLLSVNPDGSTDWEDFIYKSQVSREDYGRNSSYCMLSDKMKLHFIFNEEVSYNSNVMLYSYSPAGGFERDVVFNSEQKQLLLIPQMGKQVSANEIVVPSIYKNNLTFVKLTF